MFDFETLEGRGQSCLVIDSPFVFFYKVFDNFFHYQIRNKHVGGQFRASDRVEVSDFLKVFLNI